MSAWTCRQLSERSPKRSFHLVFESHDGTAYVPIPERSTSLRVTSTPPVVDSQKRLTPNGRLEKRTLNRRFFCAAQHRSFSQMDMIEWCLLGGDEKRRQFITPDWVP